MADHGLGTWTLEWNRSKRIAGQCVHMANGARGIIILSKAFAEVNLTPAVRETILHEIAHALTPGHNHDYVWRRKALEIGSNGKPCVDIETENVPEAAWKAICSKHGVIAQYHRAPLRVHSCGRCGRGFNPTTILAWQKDGRAIPPCEMPDRYVVELTAIIKRYGTSRIKYA
jgi:hypothetical protein